MIVSKPMTITISPLFCVVTFSPFRINADFSCDSNSTPACYTYLTYRTRSPDYIYIKNISDLIGVSPDSIAEANKIQYINEPLPLDKLLLIPITCSCNGSYYFFDTTYEFKKGDTFYSVSISHFQNLTNYLFVVDHNPNIIPENITVGSKGIFPLLCRCPSKAQSVRGIIDIITYVWQPKDDVFLVGSMFDVPHQQIISENNYRNFTDVICLPVLIPVSHQPVIYQYSSPKGQNRNLTLVSVFCPIGAVILIVFASLLLYCRIMEKKRPALLRKSSQLETFKSKNLKNENFVNKLTHDKLLPDVSDYLGQPTVYKREEIMKATMDLSERYKIGGSVYKAMIKDQVFAIKKADRETEELKLLQKLNHGNIVKLIGISSDFEDNYLLVFEYADNGSLDKWLHRNPSSGSVAMLTWQQRLNIALDVANGLQYMHEHTQPSIVHGDIKSSNILLSSRFKAKISNFSVAKAVTNLTVTEIDVFAFGLILFELLSGKKASETSENREIARGILVEDEGSEERLRRWIDPNLEGFYPVGGALNLASLAEACTSEKFSERPKMAEIVFNLSVLTESSLDGICERSISGVETEASVEIVKPVFAR